MSRFVLPRESTFNINGLPQDGAFLEFFNIGLLTNKDTFFDEDLASGNENTNPVVANGSGLFGEIWLNGDYDVTLKDKGGALIWGPETIRSSLDELDNKLDPLTVSVMVNDVRFSVTDIGISAPATKERSTGNGGGGKYDIVLTSSVTPNGQDIIIGIAEPLISFVLREANIVLDTQLGAIGDDSLDNSAILNRLFVLQSGKEANLSDGTFNLGSTRLNILNPIIINMLPTTILKQDATTVAIMAVTDTQDVTINANKAQLQHNNSIAGSNSVLTRGSTNIVFNDLVLKDAPKDGFNAADSVAFPGNQNDGIWYNRCIVQGSRRQGCSITHGKKIRFRDCEFKEIDGDLPQAGIDLEANPGNSVSDVKINGCDFHDIPNQAGVIIANASDVTVDDNDFEDNLVGVTIAAVAGGADAGQSVVAITSGDDNIEITGHNFLVGDNVFFSVVGGGTMPTPLIANVRYRVFSVVSVNKFTISDFYKTSPIDITTNGTLPLTVFKQDPAKLDNIWVTNNRFKNMTTSSVNGNTARNVTIAGNKISGSGAGTADISMLNIDDCDILDNRLSEATNGEGIFLSGPYGNVKGNTINGAKDAGIRYFGGFDSNIDNNKLIDCGVDSVKAMDVKFFNDGSVSGNRIHDESALGVAIGIDMNNSDCTGNILAGNLLKDSANNNANALLNVDSSNFVSNTVLDDGAYEDGFSGSETWDPGNILDGDQEQEAVTVTNARLGDFAEATLSVDVQGLKLEASVTSSGIVKAILSNNTGGAIDIGSSTLRVRVRKA